MIALNQVLLAIDVRGVEACSYRLSGVLESSSGRWPDPLYTGSSNSGLFFPLT